MKRLLSIVAISFLMGVIASMVQAQDSGLLQTQLWISVQESPSDTFSDITAIAQGYLYPDGGNNIQFSLPASGVDNTFIYLVNDSGTRYSVQSHSILDDIGDDLRFKGFLNIGSKDPRSFIDLDWSATSDGVHTWYYSYFSPVTMSLVYTQTIRPWDTVRQGVVSLPATKEGYYIFASAYVTPEPGSWLTLSAGASGLLLALFRRRRL